MNLEELRCDIAQKQKKGLPFICASVVIWLLILVVILLDLPQQTENMFVFCCSCPLLPISWGIGKALKVDICQHDSFLPIRVKGRNEGKPQWGQPEILKGGQWVDYK